MKIPITSILVNPKILARVKIRQEFIEELKSSMEIHGQLVPIVVRPLSNNTYELIDGLHRLEAAKKLNWKSIEAIVVGLSDADALIYSITHNIIRLQMDPLDEAQAIYKLMMEYDLTENEIARRLGRSTTWVSQRLALALKLPEEVKSLLEKGEIQLTHAIMATKIADRAKQIQFVRTVEKYKLTIEEAQKLLVRLINDTIYTVGYEGRTLEDLVEILNKNEIKVVIDIRHQAEFVNQQFTEELLKRILPQHNIKYVYLKELGVPEILRKPYVEGKIPHDCFKAYYVEAILKPNVELLTKIIEENRAVGRIALMCFERHAVLKEKQKHYCHRSFVAEYLVNEKIFDKVVNL
jgi:ParB family chromosome partitioning protein